MTARLDSPGSDRPEAALFSAADGDDPLATFPPEPQRVGKAPVVPFAAPNVIDGKPRAAPVINRLKRVFQALDIARDIEKTVDNRLAALRGLDHEVQDRARRLELLNQEIVVGARRADDVLRAIGSLERPLAELRRHTQDLRALETTVTAIENRAQIVSTSLGRQVAACEAREAAVVDAMEQLGRRAAGTIDNLEGRVGECEARAGIAERVITRLCDASSRTLPVVQERTKEAEEQNRSLGQLVSEAERMAASLTALEKRLPTVDRCDQDLARIELAVPHIAQQLEDLYAGVDQQRRALAFYQQRVRETLHESQKTASVVSELEGRIAGLSGTKDELQREIARCHQQIERLTMAAQGEAESRHETRQHSEYQEANSASSPHVHNPSNTVGRLITWRVFAPAHPFLRGAAFALSAAIVVLVGSVWRIGPAENQRTARPLRSPVLSSRSLTLATTFAMVPPRQLTADSSGDRLETARTHAVPAVSVIEGSITPRFVGTLLIDSDPAGAAVFVNQKSVGNTPVHLKNMRAGSYVVRLEHEGYQRWSTSAMVSAVRDERVKAKLERERSR